MTSNQKGTVRGERSASILSPPLCSSPCPRPQPQLCHVVQGMAEGFMEEIISGELEGCSQCHLSGCSVGYESALDMEDIWGYWGAR